MFELLLGFVMAEGHKHICKLGLIVVHDPKDLFKSTLNTIHIILSPEILFEIYFLLL